VVKAKAGTKPCIETKEFEATPLGLSEETLIFEGCSVSTPANCTITGNKIKTAPLISYIVEGVRASKGRVLESFTSAFANEDEKPFAIPIEGATCTASGTQNALGRVLAEAVGGKTELEIQKFLFEPEESENLRSWRKRTVGAGLTAGGSRLTVAGEISMALTSTSLWGAY
jgi:hypothetical protein